jgi:hypothetical protein
MLCFALASTPLGGEWITVRVIKKKDSSTRSSERKSGKPAEMVEGEKVGLRGVF